jgi:hypothetical protein
MTADEREQAPTAAAPLLGCAGCRDVGPLLTAPGTSGRSWQCGTCRTVWALAHRCERRLLHAEAEVEVVRLTATLARAAALAERWRRVALDLNPGDSRTDAITCSVVSQCRDDLRAALADPSETE